MCIDVTHDQARCDKYPACASVDAQRCARIQHVLGRISCVDAHRCARMGQGGRELILARRACYCSPCCCRRIRITVRSAFAFAHARVQMSGASDAALVR